MVQPKRRVILLGTIFCLAGLLSGCGLLEIFGRGLAALCDAETYVVTKTDDTNDGICTTDDCSLREAVLTANACSGEHTIELPAGVYGLSIAGRDEDEAATGDLDFATDITLIGEGSIIDGNGLDAVISIMEGADAALIDLIVQGGSDSGIRVYGHLRMDEVTVRNNVGSIGGGVVVWVNGEATLDAVTIEDNRGDYGGGIHIVTVGQATISGSTIRNNYANENGGGVWSQGASYTVISDTLITGN
ncbi:MAG: CSLREA domain-containing protein, partial [Anaerolineales bacterium]